MSLYTPIYQQQSLLMDGGVPDGYTNILARAPVFNEVGAMYWALKNASIQNGASSAIVAAFAARLHTSFWKAGQWTHATTTYTDDTADAQDSGTADFALETTTNDDGFVVQSAVPINVICLLIATASSGGTPVRTLEYTTASGTWTTIPSSFVGPVTSGHWSGSATETLIFFPTPADLAVIDNGHGTGLKQGWFGYRVRATTAPSGTAGVATSISVARASASIRQIGANQTVTLIEEADDWIQAPSDALVAVVDSADADHFVSCQARVYF